MEFTKEQEEMLEDMIPDVVLREEWKAKTPTAKLKLKHPIEKVVFVHSKSNPCYSQEECIYATQKLQERDMDAQDKSDIDHNFVIGRDGTVLEGRGWNHSSSLIEGPDPECLSGKSIEIAFIGHECLKPTRYQLKAALGLIVTGIKNKYLSDNIGVYQFEFEDPVFPSPGDELTEEDSEEEGEKRWNDLDEEERKKFIAMNEELGNTKIEDI